MPVQVWFLGKADVQKIKGNPHLQKTNFGYDDERGDYQVVVSDHIAYRYEVQGVLGKGSFGQVLKVLDYKTGTYKALKVIRNKKRFHHQVCPAAECRSSFPGPTGWLVMLRL
jgi:dual specificity tyrosine-phosphorylation-regulated kinase 2/3/4